MWVRSQDKGYLVKNPIIDIDIKKNEVYILDRTYAKVSFIGRILGVYKSKERAIEVLDEIHEKIINLEYGKAYKCLMFNEVVYEMPKE